MEALARNFGLRFTYIEYPLGPEQDVNTGHEVVRQAYDKVLADYPEDNSAGGGLALALLHHLRDGGDAQMPSRTVLISPWVDASLSNAKAPDGTAAQEVIHRLPDLLRTRLVQTSQDPNGLDQHDEANEARIVASQLFLEDSYRRHRLVSIILGQV